MYRRILFGVFAVACLVAQPLYAAEVQPKVTVDRSMSFRALKHTAYLEFRWKRYASPSTFAEYFIVRSEPDGPTAPEAGDIVATTTNRYSTNVEDRPPHKGTYYYRLCVIKKDRNIVCSKAVKVLYEGLVTTAALHASVTPPAAVPVVASPAIEASPKPNVTILDANPEELSLNISAAGGASSGAMLSWTPAQQHDAAFQKYILVRSFTNAMPAYPYDGYLAKISDSSMFSFTDTVYVDPAMTFAQRWYRVCTLEGTQSVRCGVPVLYSPIH